tara:strand:+ start:2453 stop:3295 length:843 start_codon:yes stop_codon:yes gene_type:complete
MITYEKQDIEDTISIEQLWALGYFSPCESDGMPTVSFGSVVKSKKDCREAVAKYQEQYKTELIIDGELGPVTKEHLDSRKCWVPDRIVQAESQSAWPRNCMRSITCSQRLHRLRPLEDKDIDNAWLEALTSISKVSGLNLIFEEDHEESDIFADVGNLSNGTLAWSYLANGSCTTRLEQKYNRSKTWSKELLLEVIVHELLHACGLGHTSGTNSIMHPTVTGRFTEPQAWEIKQMLDRYGPSKDTPSDTPNERKVGNLTIDGKQYDIIDPSSSNGMWDFV